MEVFPVVNTELCLLVFLCFSIFHPSFFPLIFLLYYYSDERGEQGENSKTKPAQEDYKVPTFFFRIHNRTKKQVLHYTPCICLPTGSVWEELGWAQKGRTSVSVQGALQGAQSHESPCPGTHRHLVCNSSPLETLPAVCCTPKPHSEQPPTLPALAGIAVHSPPRCLSMQEVLLAGIAVRSSPEPSCSAAGSPTLSSWERCPALPRMHILQLRRMPLKEERSQMY